MKKRGIILTALMAAAVFSGTAMAAGVEVNENDASATGYTASFSYEDAEATNVNLVGGFQFYVKNDINVYSKGVTLTGNDSVANHLVGPDEWEADKDLVHVNDDSATIEMTKDENGVWTADVDLPGGSYLYQYSVSYDNGETYEKISDPANLPELNAEPGSGQTRCKFFVPYDEKQGDEEYYDWSWLTPIEDESKQGTIEVVTYDGLDVEQYAQIYLPAGYDAEREEPYKVLYLSHGGGGNEADWFHQGNAANIIDRLIADGECEEFVIVCMLNEVYRDMFEDASNNNEYFLHCYENIRDYLIPYVEENYNISSETEDKAFVGLSNGAKLTDQIYINDPGAFGYFGFFSGSAAWAWPELEDYSEYKNADIYLGAGWADQLMMGVSYHTSGDKTLMGMKEQLDAAGIEYNDGGSYVTVEGAHDWWVWPQLLRDYVSTTLWK